MFYDGEIIDIQVNQIFKSSSMEVVMMCNFSFTSFCAGSVKSLLVGKILSLFNRE